jgi:hypothetical protein
MRNRAARVPKKNDCRPILPPRNRYNPPGVTRTAREGPSSTPGLLEATRRPGV